MDTFEAVQTQRMGMCTFVCVLISLSLSLSLSLSALTPSNHTLSYINLVSYLVVGITNLTTHLHVSTQASAHVN